MAVNVAEEFGRRLNLVRAQDAEKVEWMNATHAQLSELTRSYSDCCADLEQARIAGRETQKRAADLACQLQELQQSIADSSFVLVLLDADTDAYIFKDDYYLNSEGGKKAALNLQTRVRSYLEAAKPELSRLPIVIKAYCNGDGLLGFLSDVGVAQSSSALWDFAKGFSQAHTVSDFVFVGHGKDRADKKIKGIFEQFVNNPTCRHIIFGACHDNGYVRMLEDFANDDAVVEQVTLLYSYSVGREFYKLPFKSTTIDSVFRSTSPQAQNKATTVNSGGATVPESMADNKSKSWSARVKNRSNSGGDTGHVGTPSMNTVLVNAAGQRVDATLPRTSQASLDSWRQKVKGANMRYCRNYQLSGNCQGGCGYSHSPLSDEEKVVYRVELRGKICYDGVKCRDRTCYYRHNCSCKKAMCKFPKEMHGIDRVTAKVVGS